MLLDFDIGMRFLYSSFYGHVLTDAGLLKLRDHPRGFRLEATESLREMFTAPFELETLLPVLGNYILAFAHNLLEWSVVCTERSRLRWPRLAARPLLPA